MSEESKDEIKESIIVLVKKAGGSNTQCDSALKYSQAALNLAHVQSVLQTNKLKSN